MATPISSPASSAPSTPTTPASMAQRLQLQQTVIDTWTTAEKLMLASAVLKSGDQNWVSVSRQLKAQSESDRPNDWFSQKNCALQYNKMLEEVEKETPKRKRGVEGQSGGQLSGETPGEAIYRKLKEERIKELWKRVEELRKEIVECESDVAVLDSDNEDLTDEQMDEIERRHEEMEKKEAEKVREIQEMLKEREEKKKALTAALKNTANSGQRVFRGAVAQAVATAQKKQLAAQAEQEKGAGSDEEDGTKTPTKTEKLSGEESTSPLLQLLLKSPTSSTNATGASESPQHEKSSGIDSPAKTPSAAASPTKNFSEEVKEKDDIKDIEIMEEKEESLKPISSSKDESELSKLLTSPVKKQQEGDSDEEVEIKQEVKEEVKKCEETNENDEDDIDVEKESTKDEDVQKEGDEETFEAANEDEVEKEDEEALSSSRRSTRATRGSVAKPSEPEGSTEEDKAKLPPPPLTSREARKKRISEKSDELDSSEESSTRTSRGTRQSVKKEESEETGEHRRLSRLKNSSECSSPDISAKGRRGSSATKSRSASPNSEQDIKVEGADDQQNPTPTSTRRLRRRSGKTSEADDSFFFEPPSSPAVSDASDLDVNIDHKTFKKHAMQIWHQLSMHKNSLPFSSPVTLHNYKAVVKHPTDLGTIKKQIENGVLKTMTEFHREVLLMLLNAAMFNSSDSTLYDRALFMARDYNRIFKNFRDTQMMILKSSEKRSSSGSGLKGVGNKGDRKESRKRQGSETGNGGSAKKRRK